MNLDFCIFILLVAATTSIQAYFMDNGGNGFTFYATTLGNTKTALICITGRVPENAYIGFGIPINGTTPTMLNSDITMIYYSKKTVRMIHGHGMAIERPIVVTDKSMNRKTKQTLVQSQSSYKNGILKACFQRSIAVAQRVDGNNLVLGKFGYLWASGPVLNGVAQYHIINRGSVFNVSLFGVPPKTKTTGKAAHTK